MIRLTETQWDQIHDRLAEDYQHRSSVLRIRDVMRREIGCVVRQHRQWQDTREQVTATVMLRHSSHMQEWICLDFYDPARETWFRLKYAEYLE